MLLMSERKETRKKVKMAFFGGGGGGAWRRISEEGDAKLVNSGGGEFGRPTRPNGPVPTQSQEPPQESSRWELKGCWK